MGLGHLPSLTIDNDPGYRAIFNNTWGHYAPKKNISYKGIVRFVITDHSQYGSQPIILQYEFPNLEGPYIHDELFRDVCEWNNKDIFKTGVIYDIIITFRNYRFYYGKPKAVFSPLSIN